MPVSKDPLLTFDPDKMAEQIDVHEARIIELRDEIALLEHQVYLYRMILASTGGTPFPEPPPPSRHSRSPLIAGLLARSRDRENRFAQIEARRTSTLVDRVVELLSDLSRRDPERQGMTARQLFNALGLSGESAMASLITAMRRDPRLARSPGSEGFVYHLAVAPMPLE